MKKQTFVNTTLNCYMQEEVFSSTTLAHGILTYNPVYRHFNFEETIREKRIVRNPKLYDGKYISMVRKKDGKYKFHMKVLPSTFDPTTLQLEIFKEITEALQILH